MDEILNLIESVSEGFPSYSLTSAIKIYILLYWRNVKRNVKQYRIYMCHFKLCEKTECIYTCAISNNVTKQNKTKKKNSTIVSGL